MKIFTRILFALALTGTLLAQQPGKDTADQPAKGRRGGIHQRVEEPCRRAEANRARRAQSRRTLLP